MAPLKYLEQEYPILDSNFQNFCATHGIFSGPFPPSNFSRIYSPILTPSFTFLGVRFAPILLLFWRCSLFDCSELKDTRRKHMKFRALHKKTEDQEDLLLHDLHVLVAFAEQQSTSERLKQGITQVLSIIDGQHQPWLNGMELLEEAQLNKHVLSTGCEGIDLLLEGGLRMGQLTELVGASSSGKTQVCLLATSNVAKKHMGGVVYLDTGNSFSPQRVIDFIRQNSDPAIDQAKHRILQKVMNRILCHSVFDIFTMFDVLHQLEVNLRSQMQKGDCQVRLLIVDSISSLVTPILGGGGSQGHALMTSAGFLLKKLAHEHNLVVLVTNHTVGGEGGISKPALGESWKSIPHVRLRLSHDQGSSIYNVSVFKHPSMVSGKAARFTIYD